MEISRDSSTISIVQTPTDGFTEDLERFSNYLYNELSTNNTKKNVIFSPFSIQTSAAMLLMGTETDSETFYELRNGLQFSSSNILKIANHFDTILTAYQQYNILKTANKMYILKGYKIQEPFNEILTEKFHSKPETIKLDNTKEAAKLINSWVASRTNNLIQNLIKPDMLSTDARLILINVIHFKGEWEIRFDVEDTRKEDFYLNDSQRVRVSMMHVQNNFLFAELKELDATALQMNYKDSDLSMLVILPNTKTGIKNLESKLQSTTLTKITNLLTKCTVDVKFPKFKAEFEQEFSLIFQALGIKRIFADNAELGKIITSKDPLKVDQIFHKSVIEVNELGTEAAAATAIVMMFRSLPNPPPMPHIFHANRPFFYTIFHRSHGHIFMGNVVSEFAAGVDVIYSSITRTSSSSHIRVGFRANRPFFYGIFNSNGIRFIEGKFQGL